MLKIKPPTISIIGAGSPTFTPDIFSDICKTPLLKESKIIFYDNNIDKLEKISSLCEIYSNQQAFPIEIISVHTLKEAISNVDYIVNVAMENGWKQLNKIRQQIAIKTGITAPVEAHAHYPQLKFLLNVAHEIQKINPHATLIQCANPIAESGTLISRETNIKFIGVCHGSRKISQFLGLLGMNCEEVQTTIAGINHNLWLLDIIYRGKNAYPMIDSWINQISKPYIKYIHQYLNSADYQISPAAIDMYKYFKLFPVGDTTRASQPHMKKWRQSEIIQNKYYGPTKGRDSIKGFSEKMSEREQILKNIDNQLTSHVFPISQSGWQVSDIITSLHFNIPTTQIVNVINNGILPQLPDNLVIEAPLTFDSAGPHTNKTYNFPDKVLNKALRPHWQQIENHVEAFITKNKKLLIHQIASNSYVNSVKKAKQIFQIWEDNYPEMVNHYE